MQSELYLPIQTADDNKENSDAAISVTSYFLVRHPLEQLSARASTLVDGVVYRRGCACALCRQQVECELVGLCFDLVLETSRRIPRQLHGPLR